ncbi:hypothetical protein EVAR_29066_1 [Eumeta japonica]|uniref:Uncharacterized protein n=1 Tax=Eumeta variegata TaxID=151549 RepID=A0A4C1VLE6_EUMVA|nr:hypothetical protein EVAR_29066_1 [Eumeta japonica]
MSFSSTLLHARKSRANSEISELLTARRMDITVWMSSPNDEVPAVAEAGATRVARGGQLLGRSRAALGGSVGFGLPTGWRRGEAAAGGWFVSRKIGEGLSDIPIVGRMLLETIHAGGFSPDSRVRRHSGPMWDQTFHSAGPHDSWRPRGRTTGSSGTALDLLSCAGPLLGYQRPHTMFRLLNIFLASSVLGRTARTSHNGEPSLRQSLCTECTGKPWPQRSAWISSTGKSVECRG